LAGSSALVTAALHCLMEYYEVDIPKVVQPNVILGVEARELGISAGLQDRVSQVYQGCVYMDFDRAFMDAHDHGRYEEIDPQLLPEMFIAYRTDLAEGSEVFHNDIRERWRQGDAEVLHAMQDFAAYTDEVRALLLAGRGSEIGPWLDKNFDRRRDIYTAMSPRNIELVQRAREVGAHCKFAGSGGAIVGTYPDEATLDRIRRAFLDTPTVVMKPEIALP
jgi:glucuronokinase